MSFVYGSDKFFQGFCVNHLNKLKLHNGNKNDKNIFSHFSSTSAVLCVIVLIIYCVRGHSLIT